MNIYPILVIIATALVLSYIIIHVDITGITLQAQVQGPASITNTLEISNDISMLDNNARYFQTSVQSTLDEIRDIDILMDPNRNLSQGEKADIRNRLDQVDVECREYEYKLRDMTRKQADIDIRIDGVDQSDPLVEILRNEIKGIKIKLADIQGMLNDIYSIRARINISRL